MESIRPLVGTAVPDERPLAGMLVGWMFIVGSILTTILPLLPGSNGKVLTPTLPLAFFAFGWGAYAIWRLDWRAAPGWVMHVSLVSGVACIAVATHDTGGVSSPARFLLLLALVFSAYFFKASEAWPYLGLVLVAHGLPFIYDAHALRGELLGEILIFVPCYWLLAFLLISGKRGMVALRAEADALARQDPLTGLANRRALLEAINGGRGDLGLLVLDVDDFKSINTLHGHPGGDRALVYVADCIRASCRAHDLPARLGGDEFAVLVHRADEDGMAALGERLLARVRGSDTVRVSAGWVVGGPDADQLLKDADEALAEAKRAGKNRALSYS